MRRTCHSSPLKWYNGLTPPRTRPRQAINRLGFVLAHVSFIHPPSPMTKSQCHHWMKCHLRADHPFEHRKMHIHLVSTSSSPLGCFQRCFINPILRSSLSTVIVLSTTFGNSATQDVRLVFNANIIPTMDRTVHRTSIPNLSQLSSEFVIFHHYLQTISFALSSDNISPSISTPQSFFVQPSVIISSPAYPAVSTLSVIFAK